MTALRRVRWIATPAAMLALVLSLAVAASSGGAAPAGDRATTAAKKKKKKTKVKLIDTRFGDILADGKGFALYLFTRDQDEAPAGGPEESRCYGRCADAWPVLRKRGKLKAGSGLSKDELGFTRRRNGDKQVTFNGHPLYYYVGDSRPEQVLCQDVPEFGGVWYVVGSDGEAVL